MCIYTQHTHTHTHTWIQRKSRQKLVSSKHTGRRKWTAFTKISMFITFLPREAAVTSVKTKPLREAWPLTGLRNQSKDFGAMTAPTNGTGGSQEWHQGHISGCSLNHTCTGMAQTAQLGGQKGPQVSAAARCRTAQSGNSGRPSHLPAKTKNELCFGLGFMFTTKMSLKKQDWCWYLGLMQYVGASMFLLDRSKACVNGQC